MNESQWVHVVKSGQIYELILNMVWQALDVTEQNEPE